MISDLILAILIVVGAPAWIPLVFLIGVLLLAVVALTFVAIIVALTSLVEWIGDLPRKVKRKAS